MSLLNRHFMSRFVAFCAVVMFAPKTPCIGQQDQKLDKSRPVLEMTKSMTLDPKMKYGSLRIMASDIVIDGQGAWLIGESAGPPKNLKGTAISAKGHSNVTLKNINAKGWETGLQISDGTGWTIENCDFSNNFHDPDFGWGENGRRGGIVLERVHKSTLRKNKANQVWDACVLVDSNDNLIEENDFSHTSNTCFKLWTACRNHVRKNVLSHGIRISPGEVHARDSTSVLIESGSNDNHLEENDCTHGGDGIFVRVLNGWCSTGNLFEKNDCSFANNNGIECWAPRNVFVQNKANHCSYGFWLGGSDQTRLIDNEASFNGLASGHHNSPHLPSNGHAGIVFMFGPSSHTIAKGNHCDGNNGAGIALIGDLDSKGQRWKAYHWILEGNQLNQNRWGIYVRYADWVTLAGNRYDKNSVSNVQLDGDVTRFSDRSAPLENAPVVPQFKIDGPTSVRIGESGVWKVREERGPPNSTPSTGASPKLTFTWDIGNDQFRYGPQIETKFDQEGFRRMGVNVSNGQRTELAWKNVYVVKDVKEIGTEGDPANWSVEDFHDRNRSNEQVSRAKFSSVEADHLVGKTALEVKIQPYMGFRVALRYPKQNDANWSLKGKTKLVFWLKAINQDVTGWQGGPFIVLYGKDNQRRWIEPKAGLDLMRQLDNNEAREGWRLMQIPLDGNDQWQGDGDPVETLQSLSLNFDSWGAPPLQFWIDGLAFE